MKEKEMKIIPGSTFMDRKQRYKGRKFPEPRIGERKGKSRIEEGN